jgi:hypothetical protein
MPDRGGDTVNEPTICICENLRDCTCLGPEVDRLHAEVERLREALRWYADENNWLDGAAGEWIEEPGHPGSYDGFTHDEFEHDNGEKARVALEHP